MQGLKLSISVMNVLPESVALGTGAMLSQREKGMTKYGTSLEEAALSAGELAEHALQEAADGLVYGVMLAKKVRMLEDQFIALQTGIAATDTPAVVSSREKRLEQALMAVRDLAGKARLNSTVVAIFDTAEDALK